MNKTTTLCMGLAAALASGPALAQHAGHAPPGPPAPKPAPREVQGHDKHRDAQPAKAAPVDHSTMDHSTMDHSTMDHSTMDHSTMDHSTMEHAADLPADAAPREPIPAVTDADRAAAFPPVHAHHQHGTSIHSHSVIDRLEASRGDHGTGVVWDGYGWVGGDVQKFWWRTEGHGMHGRVEDASVEALYGRGVRAWWDVVAGVRHDIGEGPDRTWLAVGVQGLAPYKFEVSSTVYLGQGGRTALVAEAEYDTLVTNRWILQWRAEASVHGKDDPERAIGSGLSGVEAGARLRYEFHRQFAPYIGIEHDRAFGRTADFRRAAGDSAGDTKLVAGVRIWF